MSEQAKRTDPRYGVGGMAVGVRALARPRTVRPVREPESYSQYGLCPECGERHWLRRYWWHVQP